MTPHSSSFTDKWLNCDLRWICSESVSSSSGREMSFKAKLGVCFLKTWPLAQRFQSGSEVLIIKSIFSSFALMCRHTEPHLLCSSAGRRLKERTRQIGIESPTARFLSSFRHHWSTKNKSKHLSRNPDQLHLLHRFICRAAELLLEVLMKLRLIVCSHLILVLNNKRIIGDLGKSGAKWSDFGVKLFLSSASKSAESNVTLF